MLYFSLISFLIFLTVFNMHHTHVKGLKGFSTTFSFALILVL